MTNRDAALAMDAARIWLVSKQGGRGYLQAALWSMITMPAEGIGTMAMSKDAVIYYDPEEMLKLSLEARVLMLYHELCHWMRKHYERLGELPDETLAGYAADLEIQQDLEPEVARDSGLEWPPCGYIAPGKPPFEDLPRGKVAEEYYRLLEQQQRQSGGQGQRQGGQQGRQRQQGQGGGQGQQQGQQQQQGRGNGGAQEQGQQQRQGQESGGGQQESQGQQEDQGQMPPQGSVSDGRWKPWEQPNHPEGKTEAQARLIMRKLAQDIQDAAERDGGHGIGSVPGWMRRWADAQLSSKVPWQRVLDRWVRQAIGHALGFSDYDFRVPNRRAALSGLIMPGLVKPVPRIAVVLDTSGSMSRRQIALALGEIHGVLKAMGAMEGVWVLATDAEAHTCQRVFNPRQVEIMGGGGTNMESGIARAMQLRPRPGIVIVISDCHNYWEDAKPARVSVVVVRVGTGDAPAWADKVIDVDEVGAGEYGTRWGR
jgi:predicted metal-dependent peptidase